MDTLDQTSKNKQMDRQKLKQNQASQRLKHHQKKRLLLKQLLELQIKNKRLQIAEMYIDKEIARWKILCKNLL